MPKVGNQPTGTAKQTLKPILVNRGAAGLLGKIPKGAQPATPVEIAKKPRQVEINKIAPALQALIVDIETLVPDPVNARLHPERNLEAIMDSLCAYGQMKPLVVREETNIVVAGNGTLEAAKKLGWTKIAAAVNPMTDVDAAGYGLADNRSAELAKWDFEVVARLDKLMQEQGHDNIGWSVDELTVLRTTDWKDVPIEDHTLDGLDIPEGDPEGEERAPGDAELLMKLQVTIDDPTSKVLTGEVYRLGDHLLVIADVVREVHVWRPYLEDALLFCPYPGPLLPLTVETGKMLMVQPDAFIAGHILDRYKEIHGEEAVQLEVPANACN